MPSCRVRLASGFGPIMYLLGDRSSTLYRADRLLARAGEGAVYTVAGHPRLLVKVFDHPPTADAVDKLRALAAWPHPPAHTALPAEIVYDPARTAAVGFTQPYFTRTVPLTRYLDAHTRRAARLPTGLPATVRLVRLLAEAFARLHAARLVMGDVSDSNFLARHDWLGRPAAVCVIDCNSFHVAVRTPAGHRVYPSGVATEEYAAPEVQAADWATGSRTEFTDAFGLAVLAWKVLFNGSHPFAVVTPRGADVPPLGERIRRRQFPFAPPVPLPAGWSPPPLTPCLTALPAAVRDLFVRAFTAPDPRDRPAAGEWRRRLAAWERSVPVAALRGRLGAWTGRATDLWPRVRTALGPAALVTALAALTAVTGFEPEGTPPTTGRSVAPPGSPDRPVRPTRPRVVDPDLFPAAPPSHPTPAGSRP